MAVRRIPPTDDATRSNRMAGFTDDELAVLERTTTTLAAEAEQERRRRAIAEPDWGSFTFSVQYSPGGVRYPYAAIRAGGRIYTTGTNPEDSVFDNWQLFINWLRGPDKHLVTPLTRLVPVTSARIRIPR